MDKKKFGQLFSAFYLWVYGSFFMERTGALQVTPSVSGKAKKMEWAINLLYGLKGAYG